MSYAAIALMRPMQADEQKSSLVQWHRALRTSPPAVGLTRKDFGRYVELMITASSGDDSAGNGDGEPEDSDVVIACRGTHGEWRLTSPRGHWRTRRELHAWLALPSRENHPPAQK